MNISFTPITQRLYKPNAITHTSLDFRPSFAGLKKDTFELQSKQNDAGKKACYDLEEARVELVKNGFNYDKAVYIVNKISEADTKTEQKHIVSSEVLDDVKEMKKYAEPNDIQKLVSQCYNPKSKKFNKGYFNIARKFFEHGVSYEKIAEITEAREPAKYNFTKEDADYMFSNLPDIKNKDFLAYFIEWRFCCSNVYSESKSCYVIKKDFYDLFNKIYNSGKHWQNPDDIKPMAETFFYRDACYTGRPESKKIFQDKFKYLVENAQDPDTRFILETINFREADINEKDSQALIKYTKLGADRDYLFAQFIERKFPFENSVSKKKTNERLEKFQKLKNDGIKPAYILPLIEKPYTDEEMKILLELIDAATTKRDKLGSVEEPYSDCNIINLLFIDDDNKNISEKVLKTVKLLGKDSCIKLIDEGADVLSEYFCTLGADAINLEFAQPLLKMINPTECDEVKALEQKIKELKQQLANITDENERQEQFNKINSATKQKNDILNNAIKDHSQKAKSAMIYMSLINTEAPKEDSHKLANKLAPYLNPKTDEEKQLYRKKLSELLWDSNGIVCSDEIKNKCDFSDSPYFESLFQTYTDFDKGLGKIIKILDKYPEKSVHEALMTLPQNKKTEKLLKKYNIDFDKWSKFNPDLKLEISYVNDSNKMEANAIKNLENEFNDKFFLALPKKEQKNMIDAINKGGYQLVKKKLAEYDEDGYIDGTEERYKLLKEGKPIEFKDLSKVLKIISRHISENEFWNKKLDLEDNGINAETFKDHLSARFSEIKTAKQTNGVENINITIQKADMNDIKHSLFLGNDSCCCTAVNSFNGWSAPQYIMNKVAQCIEIKDGDKSVGNTMIYPILVKGKPALFLDNIELKPKYQYNQNIEDGICEFAKILAKEVGISPKNIYAGPNRHKLDMNNFRLLSGKFNILGVTDRNGIYVDCIGDGLNLEENLDDNEVVSEFYKLNSI